TRATEEGPADWTQSDGPRSDARDRHWHRDGGHAGQGDPVAQLARPPRRGALRRAHRLARRKRKQKPGEGPLPIRQCSGTERDGPARVALSYVPEPERLGEVV